MRIFLTLTGYQLTWLACIFGENKFNQPNLGFYFGLFYLTLYFYFNDSKIKFLKISMLISIPGYLFDTLLVYFQFYEFQTSYNFGTLPIWMITLWLSFSTLFDKILVFFKNYKLLALFLSSSLGPLTYYLGVPIGLISINNIFLFFLLMIIFWFFLMIYYIFIVLKNYSD